MDRRVKLNKKSLLICDVDRAYLAALTKYLLKCLPDVLITSYSSTDGFLMEPGSFGVSLLGSDFLSQLEDLPEEQQDRFGKVLYLCGSDESYESHRQKLYKFQSMDSFTDQLRSVLFSATEKRAGSVRVVSVYSPIAHELRLPFAALIAQGMSGAGEVLFLDLEEGNLLQTMTREFDQPDLIDVIYLLTSSSSDEDRRRILRESLSFEGGVAYLAPARNADQLACITQEQWISLMNAAEMAGFSGIVILHDHILQGFEMFCSRSDRILLLSRDGEFYRGDEEKASELLKRRGFAEKTERIALPLSASNLKKEDLRIRRLAAGNLGRIAAQLMHESGRSVYA